jgi:predicted metal-binding membrane protein
MLALLANNQRTVNRGHTAFAFSAGYFIVWMVASTSAALLQWMLHNAGVMRDAMHLPVAVAGVLLIIAGVYQFLPLKDRCLARCRNPLSFLMSSWRDGTSGAVRMGIDYGVVCLGCCGALMVVLFAVGVMDLLAVAALAALVALEKMSSFGRQLSRVTGAALVLGGLVTLVVS